MTINTIKDLVKAALQDNNPVWVHDCTHAHISTLPRVLMGNHQVSGIHGLSHITELWGTQATHPTVDEYPSLLDKARVGIHQVLTTPTPCRIVRYAYYCTYLVGQGINPLAVTYRHWCSMH